MAKAKKSKAVKKPAKKSAKKPVKKAAPKKSPAKKASPKKSPPKKSAPPVAAKKPSVDLTAVMTPLDDRVLVRLTEAERKTPGGLFIPDTVSDVSGNLEGRVVMVGRGHRDKKGRLRPMDLKAGDRVVFAEYAGSKIRVLNEDLVILRESEVMGVIS